MSIQSKRKMKDSFITILRNRQTTRTSFKEASNALSRIIAAEVESSLSEKVSEKIVLLPILRAGIALLPAFMNLFQQARIGFIGLQRDTQATPHLYYEKLPPLSSESQIIILDPMIATGGSVLLTLEHLTTLGGTPENYTVVGMIGTPQAMELIGKAYPQTKIILATIDEGLDDQKYIVPGLGDFGDRFFGC